MEQFVTIEGRALKQAMKLMLGVVERRVTYPILSCVRLGHSVSGLTITGTDLDREITTTLDVIDGAGGDWELCIDARTLSGIASVAGVMPVRIERITTQTGGTDARITVGDDITYDIEFCPDPDGWPTLGGKRGDQIERFTNGMFAATLAKVQWCISREETRYYLNGVCWQRGENGSRFVATDGHRLAVCRYDTEAHEPAERIIPRRTIEFLTRHARGADVAVYATDKEHIIHIVSGDFTIRTKLIEGTFPNVDRVMPGPNKWQHNFDLNRTEFLTAVSQATAIGAGRDTGHAIRLYDHDGVMGIERTRSGTGRAKVRTQAVWPDTAPPEFGFNAMYIRQLVTSCEGNVTLHMIDASSPFVIKDGDETMTRVIMPMRV